MIKLRRAVPTAVLTVLASLGSLALQHPEVARAANPTAPAPVVEGWGYGGEDFGSQGSTNSPTQVSGLPAGATVTMATAGGYAAYYLTSAGVYAEGFGFQGQLGNGTTGANSDATTPVKVSGLPGNVTTISAGYDQVMALTSDGAVYVWGNNTDGELGLGAGAPGEEDTPVQLTSLSNVTSIHAGLNSNSYATTSDGKLHAWGNNSDGELGIGSTTNQPAPVTVGGITGSVTQVADGLTVATEANNPDGHSHVLALTSSGSVYAWGGNEYGQLGTTPDTSLHTSPAQVPISTKITQIASQQSNFALTSAGAVLTWGFDQEDSGGDGQSTSHASILQVTGLASGITKIGAGQYAGFALTGAGQLLAWGSNDQDQLGLGRYYGNVAAPTPVEDRDGGIVTTFDSAGGVDIFALTIPKIAISTPTSVAPGGASQLAVTAVTMDGTPDTAYAGTVNLTASDPGATIPSSVSFQAGGGGTTSVSATFTTPGKVGISAVDAADSRVTGFATTTVAQPGVPYVWGDNTYGEVGDGTTANRPAPTAVRGLPAGVLVSQLSTGADLDGGEGGYTLALLSDGRVFGWGSNGSGELGDNATTSSPTPVQAQFPSGTPSIVAVSAGYNFSLALTSAGTVYAWGDNTFGEIGDGTNTQRPTPVQVSGLSSVRSIAAGDNFGLALTNSGAVEAWGRGAYGELGNGDTKDHNAPVATQFAGLQRIVAIAAGTSALAITSAGTVLSWGSDDSGQLGNGQTGGSYPTPAVTSLPAGNAIVDISTAGAYNEVSRAVGFDGTTYSWGDNTAGEYGTGTTTTDTAIHAVQTSGGAAAVAAGFEVGAALTRGGAISIAGDNSAGELGNGTTASASTPVTTLTPTLGQPFTSVSSSFDSTSALVTPPVLSLSYPASTVAGTAQSLTVSLTKPTGGLDAAYRGTVHFTDTAAENLPADYTFTAADAGKHTFSAALTVAGNETLTATDSGVAYVTAATPVTVTDAPANYLTVSPATSAITAGASQPYTVKEYDKYGNLIKDVSSTALLTGNGNIACQNASCTTKTATAAGSPDTVTASADSVTGTAALTVNAGPVNHLDLTPTSSSIVAGSSQTYAAHEVDQYDNPVHDVTSATAFSLNGVACSQNACGTSTATPAGTPDTVTGKEAGYTATATLTVTQAAADHLVISPANPTIVAGQTQAFTAEEVDRFGNAVADVTGATTFAVAGGSCSAASCGSTVATGGTPHAVTAQDGSLSGADTLGVTPAVTTHLVISPAVATVAAGQSQNYTAQEADQYGNIRSDVTATTVFAATGGSCAANACGGTRAGATPLTVTASESGFDGTAALTVIPAALARLVVAPAASAVVAGTPVTFSATGYDAYGNSRGDVTGATSFAVPQGTCAAATCVIDTSTGAGLSDVVTATDAGVSATASLTVAPGPLDHIAVSAGMAGPAGVAVPVTVTGFDRFGNGLGDVTKQAALAIAPNGSCVTGACTPAIGGQHTVTARIAAAVGSVTLIAGYLAPSITHAALGIGDASAQVGYVVNAHGAAGLKVTLTATAHGHPTVSASSTASTGTVVVRKLVDGVRYTFTLTARAAGSTMSALGTGVPSKVPFVLLRLSSRSLKPGQALTLSGTVTLNHHPLGNRVVVLTTQLKGHKPVVVARSTTDSQGRYSFTQHPTAGRSYVVTATFGSGIHTTISRSSPTGVRVS